MKIMGKASKPIFKKKYNPQHVTASKSKKRIVSVLSHMKYFTQEHKTVEILLQGIPHVN